MNTPVNPSFSILGQGRELLLGPRNMGSNADLYAMEDTVKQKYMDIVKNMSHLELKNFSIGKYQKLNQLRAYKITSKYRRV